MKRISLIVPLLLSLQCGTLPQLSGRTTVEGQASVRGNEPFTSVLLDTAEGHTYVLVFSGAERSTLDAALPALIRVTGTVYVAKWNGLSMMHLRVNSIQHIEPSIAGASEDSSKR